MRYIVVAALLAATGVQAQPAAPSPQAPAPAATASKPRSIVLDENDPRLGAALKELLRDVEFTSVPAGTVRPGDRYRVERLDGGAIRVGPALAAPGMENSMQVIMPAAAADALVSSQTRLINELLSKVRELEGRVQKLERGGK